MKLNKKTSIKKLFINKETITILNQLHLNKVIGGYSEGVKTDAYTCNSAHCSK